MNTVHLLQRVDGKHYDHITASLDKSVCRAVKESIEAKPTPGPVRGSLVIESLRLIATVEEYETERIEREAREAINGMYGNEKNAIMAYIEQLRAQAQAMPQVIEGNEYEQK